MTVMHSPPTRSSARFLLCACLLHAMTHGLAAAAPTPAPDEFTLDHRYAPPQWQTAIGLPDDAQKTLVAKDGGLLYDYPGGYAGFGTKITFGLVQPVTWTRQELVSPRIPIVRTYKQAGPIEIVEEAFAVAPPLSPKKAVEQPALVLRRVGANSGQRGWANPKPPCDPDFRHVAIGWNGPIEYRFPAARGERFTVVFGICEGHHPGPGARVLTLSLEGKSRQIVDPVKEGGHNVPRAYPLDIQDENQDGWIDLAVTAAPESPDKNTILNLLWVFRAAEAPPPDTVVRGGPFPKVPLLRFACGADKLLTGQAPRHDVLRVTLRNPTGAAVKVTPRLLLEAAEDVWPDPMHRIARVGDGTRVFYTADWTTTDVRGRPVFSAITLAPRAEITLAFGVARGDHPAPFPQTLAEAASARRAAERYWAEADLPYGRLGVPDAAVQALLDASVRNIYQAREIKQGLPAFQVGPTCYRGLWVVDGAFLLEAVTYLGREKETRAGIDYLMKFQRADGSFMLIDGHWKETGIALWAVTRHARLTGDPAWLRGVWPRVERGVAAIEAMRALPARGAPNEGLVPDGFSDGGLAEKVPEYTNVYWTLAGLRAAVEAAAWLGNTAQADAWRKGYDDLYATFRRAAQRDMKTDGHGNRHLPIRMAKGGDIPPQKAQWAFLHAVYPGQVFPDGDPLVRGNLAMLRAAEQEGLVADTGWLKNGLWSYFGSFYAHAWLWVGDGGKAARTLYAFGNHASPLLCWREEHMPQGQGDARVGDMPHNWASAEFIRLVRHCLALERGNELHLFQGFPAAWARPGAVTRMHGIATEFGPLSLEFTVARDGRSGVLHLTPPRRTPPARILWHLGPWAAEPGAVALPTDGTVKKTVRLAGRG
ncbi:MAG: hypothetical protein JXQ71_09225 [Verrucomicrobia bacterium]|nr:hypothetical protein [Verrucomicrobiota bacterium]